MNASLTSRYFQAWLPWLLLLGVCAVLQFVGGYSLLRLDLPPAHGSWLYSLFTCHLVHLTPRHWLYDSLALLVIAWIFVDQYNWQAWLLTYCISSLTVSLGLLLFPAGLQSYAGLSGLLHGLFAMGCLLLYPQYPRLALVLGLLVLLKLVMEHFYGALLLSNPGFSVASMAHVYGLIGGLISGMIWYGLRGRRVA
jgi:rhomboid family GlyGly-CTERM serine protease